VGTDEAAWDADSVRDALNQATADHQVIVSVPEGAPALSVDQIAAATGVGVQAVTKHVKLPGAYLVEMTTAQAAQQRVQQWKAAGREGQGFIIRRERTALGVMRAWVLTRIVKGVEGELGRMRRGDVRIFRAPNHSNILLSMGTYMEIMGGRAASVQYPVWAHFRRTQARVIMRRGWEFSKGKGRRPQNMDKLGDYLAGVLRKLPPAPAATPVPAPRATVAAAQPAPAPAEPAASADGPSTMDYAVGASRLREPTISGAPAAKAARVGASTSGVARAAQASRSGQGSGGAGGSGVQ
jgi:hypothetical protein